VRHFTNRFPAAFDHERLAAIANPVEDLGKGAGRFVAEMTRLPLTEYAARTRGFDLVRCFCP
jgi:hypothetical protein